MNTERARTLRKHLSEAERRLWQKLKLVITERLTQQNIASRVGASRAMVSRILKDLTVGGYISIQRDHILLHRKPPLRW